MPRVSQAQVHKALETAEQEIGNSGTRTMRATGPAADSMKPPSVIEAATGPVDQEWASNMAFSKEKVTIRLHTSTDANAEKIVKVWNNGDPQEFPRGVDVTCERRFVESLMRAKETRYGQKAVLDERGGVAAYENVPSTALRYDFSVVRDDNPVGAAWLKSILAQP